MKKRSDDSILSEEGKVRIGAGDFSTWLRGAERIQRQKGGEASVPCGECTGCCRSSMFIHIRPDEIETLKRIPKELLFPAPGFPKGSVLMGYNERGECPMLVGNKCSIYQFRPRTCREYDCRIFAATGVSPDPVLQPVIAVRAQAWSFEVSSEENERELAALRASADFLRENEALFPSGFLPRNPSQLANLALRVFRLFLDLQQPLSSGGTGRSAEETVRAILAEVGEPLSR